MASGLYKQKVLEDSIVGLKSCRMGDLGHMVSPRKVEAVLKPISGPW